MNALTKDLMKLTEAAEREADHRRTVEKKDRFREKIHLMPPVGWLNDPNGLCQFNGIYHAFFQYSPFNAEGGLKLWGHYTSGNMIDWEYQGVSLYPDQTFDCHGVYSGSAYIEDGKMYLYYTGNVKLEDGEFDYIYNGREANTVLVTSRDGIHFGRKKEILRNADYPADLSCHVRDPKVWREKDRYYMVQGARTKNDVGQALVFESRDKVNWSFRSRIESEEPFGYMWECPDYFTVDGVQILSASVQGLHGGEWEERNVYQSGYFLVAGDILEEYSLSGYHLWDYGFDYYAPQSFETEDGRRIHISWMGMADCEEYTNPTIRDGWQHCFTFPREIYVEDGVVKQRPVRELDEKLRVAETAVSGLDKIGFPVCDIQVSDICDNRFYSEIGGGLILEYVEDRFEMRFKDKKKTSMSAGRNLRYKNMEEIHSVRILVDVSSVEAFINGGETVFSTRYYPDEAKVHIEAPEAKIRLSEIQ